MKIKTSELESVALNLAVANAVGHSGIEYDEDDGVVRINTDTNSQQKWRPSTDWSQGGLLIDKYLCSLLDNEMGIRASIDGMSENFEPEKYVGRGMTKLIAAMRAIVAAESGEEIDIPEELL